MKYQQVSRTHLIHPETFKFIKTIPEPSVIDVPFYLHTFSVEDRWNGVACKVNIAFQLQLNDLVVSWEHDRGFHSGHIEYFDLHKKRNVCLRLEALTDTAVAYSKGGSTEAFYGVDYTLNSPEFETKYHRQEYHGNDQIGHHYHQIADLGDRRIYHVGQNAFSMGISHRQWKVKYRGRTLSGSCYALLSGIWAVLLGDDLKFDSLVYLNGVERGVLSVDKFAHTVNPYIVKIMTLTKE